ncbi:TetR/AcrR family transcriptional regulator [Stackebrandtia nassauensis]|uniref:Transcriptional regulator, TetR family n=1 Tax=Stackebrandtia nassauensis (strain DSM 44728 / CIP 108903 / NRRL B-16338 / NBRC 102104 / LLR-40K-21) TaxID=446470 RepID=D3Q6I9_STANL|nr:TetR/AcrR family transcriptional regulator [Stackebrandtia nassauensis]ADD44232.1 transcriptional regulator, TetR family [Stackebrandtia nassauensis DSM 44728]
MTLTEGRGARMPRTERRRQLLDSAREEFVARGYHNTAMDDIAERAGVSKPVLYQHFPGKMDLYLALLDTHGEALVETVRTAMESTSDNKQRVHRAMQAYFDFVDAQGEAFRLVFESDLRNEPAVAERVDRVSRDCGSAIAETIMGDTGVDRQRAELLAIGLTGAAEMAARRWLASKRAVPKEEAVQLLATLSWRGISKFPLHTESD